MGHAVVTAQIVIGDAMAGGGMDHLAISYINTDMGDIHVIAGKENQITRLEFSFGNWPSGGCLNICRAGQLDTLLCVDVLNETGAVKTIWTAATPDIRNAQELLREVNDAIAIGKVGLALMLGHSAMEKGLIGMGTNFAIYFQIIILLEIGDSCFGSRAIIAVHNYVIATAGQSLLDFNNFTAGIAQLEAGGLGNRCGTQEKCCCSKQAAWFCQTQVKNPLNIVHKTR